MHHPARIPAHLPAWPGAAAALSVILFFPQLPAIGVEAVLSSGFLVRGERAQLQVIVDGLEPERLPRIPQVAGLTIRTEDGGRPRPVPLERRRIGYAFNFSVLSYEVGRHQIPPIEVELAGRSYQTRPLPIEIFGSEQMNWVNLNTGNETIRCGAAFRTGDAQPFVNEAVPVELKLYVPSDLRVEDWGIPDFQREGLTVWRFEPNRTRSQVVLNGKSFTGVAYPSTLVPTRDGEVAIGPARLRLVVVQLSLDAFGLRPEEFPVWLDVPAVKFAARPLPPGAPEGFAHAVGSFTVASAVDAGEVREGDPVVVNLEVSGTGNLDSLAPPIPLEAEGWKVYEATLMPRGDERRQLAGTVRFRQFMRPLELKGRVPPFRFVFFDPEQEEFRTLFTDPIPLRMLPSAATPVTGTAPPPAATVPVERMTDILGAIATKPPGNQRSVPWTLVWQILPASIVLVLLLQVTLRWLAPLCRRDPVRTARRRDFDRLGRTTADSRSFYRAAGAFIERWLGGQVAHHAELARILADRDRQCFIPTRQPAQLAPGERRKILRTLRRHLAAFVLTGLAAAGPGTSRAAAAEPPPVADPAAAAFAEGRFADAARIWLNAAPFDQLDPDRLHNIGNCWYRLGSAGQAALYYRRALARDPRHPEARQNLRFIERKFGSLGIKRPEYQYALAKLPLAFWQGLVWGGGWLLAIGLLCFPATRRNSRGRLAGVIALVLAPVAAGLGGLGWRYFPDDAAFAPLAQQAVVIADDAVVFTDASRTSPEVIDAPPGSLCQIIADRDRWIYVSFATHTRGWLPAGQLERLIPRTRPQPPSTIRPKAGGGNT